MSDYHDKNVQPEFQDESEHIQPQVFHTGKQPNLWQLWLSGIIGGITVAIIGFLLLFTGVIPINSDQSNANENSELTEATAQNVIQTSSSRDGVSTETISDVSEAVVGVANIQNFDLWSAPNETGTGSGVVYKINNEKAYVVTNHHVIDGANEIEVILTNGEHVSAELLGSDELTDLAVLTIDAEHVNVVAPLGDSSNLVVGEPAIAIGNPLGTEFAGTVTKGIISGLERSIDVDLNGNGSADWTVEVIQTDAAINPGNSGGALINENGEVIGINSMKIALQTVEGIGFAIPINEAIPVMEQLEVSGQISRPFIGISAVDLSTVPERNIEQTLNLDPSNTDGVVIAEVHPDSAANEAGLETYDVITAINDDPIDSMMDLKKYLYSETSIGDTITITYFRNGEERQVSITLRGEDSN